MPKAAVTEDLQGKETFGSGQTAVVFLSHMLHESVLERFEDLRHDGSSHDVYFGYDATNATRAEYHRARKAIGESFWSFTFSELRDPEYQRPWADPERKGIVPGNIDLIFLQFFQENPGYSRYWFVEYDVVYTGSWAEFFRAFDDSEAGVVGSTLRAYEQNPDWYWWSQFEPPSDVNKADWRCGFLPIVRLSSTLLERLSDAYRSGWSGHTEAVIPTVAHTHDLGLEDFGGDGPYVREGNQNRFYTNTPGRDDLGPGTFIYRPARPSPGAKAGKLWHPIKPEQGYLLSCTRLLKQYLEVTVLNR